MKTHKVDKYLLLIAIAFSVSSLSYGTEAGGLLENYFIEGSYEGLELYNPHPNISPCVTISEDNRMFNRGFEQSCSKSYRPSGGLSTPIRVLIILSRYVTDKDITNDLLIKLYKESSQIEYINSGSGTILSLKESLPQSYNSERKYWVSQKIIIQINGDSTPIPDKLLADYIQKYPPTAKLKKSSFDLDNIFKTEIRRQSLTLSELEAVDLGTQYITLDKIKFKW